MSSKHWRPSYVAAKILAISADTCFVRFAFGSGVLFSAMERAVFAVAGLRQCATLTI